MRRRGQVGRLFVEINRELTWGDWNAEQLEQRITALEEIVAARWWRRRRVVSALRRDLRASVRDVQGATFAERRSETITSGWGQRSGLGQDWGQR